MTVKTSMNRSLLLGLAGILASACNCFSIGDFDINCGWEEYYDGEEDWYDQSDPRLDHSDLLEDIDGLMDLREMDLLIGECHDVETCNGLDDDCNGVIDDVKGLPFCGDDCCNGSETALTCARDCTCEAPSTPVPLTPHSGDKTRTTRPAFRWEPSSGPCGEPYYELQVDDSCEIADYAACTFPSPEIDETEIGGTLFAPEDALAVCTTPPVRVRYFWRVRSCYSYHACSSWSRVGYLDVGMAENDLNGDGFSDLAVGAETAREGELEQGKVFLFYGGYEEAEPGPPVVLPSPTGEENARFGISVSGSGDLDGDGFCDLVVGADYHDGSAPDEGLVAVYYGTEQGIPPEPFMVLVNPLGDERARFGASVSSDGDLNGDGFDDLAVGAQWTDVETRNEGAVYVYLGSESGIGETPDIVLNNPQHQDGGHFGKSLSSGGDLNVDGYGDLAVGADLQDGAVEDEGKVYVYFGRPGGVYETPSIVIESPYMTSGHFGTSLSLSGDINWDGSSDLVIGADMVDGAAARSGAIFVFYGTNLAAGVLDFIFLENPRSLEDGRFGYSVSILGEVLGSDTYHDVAVGAPGQDTVFLLQGRAAELSFTGMVLLVPPPDSAGIEWFGEGIVRVGDMNEEAPGDFAVTGRLVSVEEDYVESVYLYSGNVYCCMFLLE